MDAVRMLALAVCHLETRAATWDMCVEESGDRLDNVEALCKIVQNEFVPSIEKSKAKMDLVAL